MSNLEHVGIIMDGNRRWAKAAGKPSIEGHRQGFKALKKLLETVQELNIAYLSVYTFSTENWNRTKEEVEGLLQLFRWVHKNELRELVDQGIRIKMVGSRSNVPDDILRMFDEVEEKTASNNNGTLAICFNYGGQREIVDAAQAVVLADEEMNEDSIAKHLYHPDLPPIDLLIRTGGEQRISNFMLWRVAYAELSFTDTLWPDFTGQELRSIVDDFNARNRRFGS